MPHFHISLQAGNNLILKRMKRRHSREMAIDFCNKVLSIRKEATFGADLIVGFPTETDEMFKETLDLVDQCHLTHLHVFPYSPRINTPAARMPQVDKSIIKDRSNRLRQMGMEKLKKHLTKKIGETDLILIEKVQNENSIGKDQNFFNVIVNEKIKEGDIVACIYTGINNDMLVAKRI
jgi:threonylcarbamoyladenosine tRNA methylthiotransferase MtaB